MDNKKFGAFVCALRKEKGWTQLELARRLNVTDKAVSKWERGAGFPDVDMLEPLAGALGVSLIELVHAERIPEPEVPIAGADEAIAGVIGAADLQRKIEHRNCVIVCVCAVAAFMLAGLVYFMGWLGFLVGCLPFATFAAGVVLLALGRRWRAHGTPYLTAKRVGALMLLYSVVAFIFWCAASLLHGPGFIATGGGYLWLF